MAVTKNFELPIKGKRTAAWFLALSHEEISALQKADRTLLLKEAQTYIERYANIINSTVHDTDAVQKFRTDRNLLIELTKKLR